MAVGLWRVQQCLDHLGKCSPWKRLRLYCRLFVSRCAQEWRTQLRSSLHPALFAAIYKITANLADLCGLTLPARAELLLATPKVTQAVFAALLDCYTWKIAEKAYGCGSRTALVAVGNRLAISLCQSLILDPASLARIVSMLPMAMVLLHPNAVQLP